MANWVKYGKNRQRPPGKWVQASALEEVWGIKHRKNNARAFCHAVKDADKAGLEYGVALAPQPENPEDSNAIAVLGQCMVKPWFRAPRLKEWHVGYVRRDLASELQDEFLSKDVPIASELYEIFEQRDFYEIKFFILAPPGNSHSARLRRSKTG